MFHWISALSELGHDYDVIVTSYLGFWYLFWYVWKEETPSYTMVPITCIGGFIFKFTGGGNHPLGKMCSKRRLARTRVKHLFQLPKYVHFQQSTCIIKWNLKIFGKKHFKFDESDLKRSLGRFSWLVSFQFCCCWDFDIIFFS